MSELSALRWVREMLGGYFRHKAETYTRDARAAFFYYPPDTIGFELGKLQSAFANLYANIAKEILEN